MKLHTNITNTGRRALKWSVEENYKTCQHILLCTLSSPWLPTFFIYVRLVQRLSITHSLITSTHSHHAKTMFPFPVVERMSLDDDSLETETGSPNQSRGLYQLDYLS